MKIQIDSSAGFCPGVRSVIRSAEEHLAHNSEVYALGELIHNPIENNRLRKNGLQVISHEDLNSGSLSGNSCVLIRAHGEPPATFKKLDELKLPVIDGTCPIVRRSQIAAATHHKKGDLVVIIGKKLHPEVIGIAGQCEGDFRIIARASDIDSIDKNRLLFVLAQTTISQNFFLKIVYKLQKRNFQITVNDTTCKYIRNRANQIRQFSGDHDAVIMVGGKNSSNTRVLFEICKQCNPNAWWIEDPDELDLSGFENFEDIGITGSASTPPWLMEKTMAKIESFFNLTPA